MATYDLWQQAYALATMSGSVSGLKGTPESLEAALTSNLTEFYEKQETIDAIGEWSIAWGPVVFESEPGSNAHADNVMYVAVNEDRSVYVVGIAGTNPHSKFDVLHEDLDVRHTTSWTDAFPSLQPYEVPSGVTGTPYLSGGTVLGMKALLGMTNDSGQSLLEFLQSLSATDDTTLIFTGHSLGAALAPTLALALFNPAGGELALDDWGAVDYYATAGPTPGNLAFSDFLGNVFPPGTLGTKAYQVWNRNVWNDIDVVPHAWDTTMMDAIPTLYPTEWSHEPTDMRVAIAAGKLLSDLGALTGAGPYEMLPNQAITGRPDSDIPVTDLKSFAEQALHQHTTAYNELLAVEILPKDATDPAAFAPVIDALLTLPAADTAGAGDDVVTGAAGAETIDLGPGADILVDMRADLQGDLISGFGLTDILDIVGSRSGRDHFVFTQSGNTTAVTVDQTTSFGFIGDFADGDFMAVARGAGEDACTIVTFEPFLPTLHEAVRVDPDAINGITNELYLIGDGSVRFTVELKSAVSAFHNTLGYYKVDADGVISDVHVLYADTLNVPAAQRMIDLDVPADGETIGFFLVQNGSNAYGLLPDDLSFAAAGAMTPADIYTGPPPVLRSAMLGNLTSTPVFHSIATLNPLDAHQVLSGVAKGGMEMQVGFEDLPNATGDNDYQDVILSVQVQDSILG